MNDLSKPSSNKKKVTMVKEERMVDSNILTVKGDHFSLKNKINTVKETKVYEQE